MENKRNFQRELDGIIKKHSENGEKPVLLLHSCCGPCSSYVLEYLCRYFRIKLFFYNPNIQPESEYRRRLETQREVAEMIGSGQVEFMEGDYGPEKFLSAVKGLEKEPEGGKRCEVCIKMRMEQAAVQAKLCKADYFATTLTVSPHKNAVYINKAGEELERETTVPYLVSDFKKKNGYKRSVELCEQYGFYRQKYCGCVFSIYSDELEGELGVTLGDR